MRLSQLLSLSVALGLLAGAESVQAASGRVVYVGGRTIFLDRGREEGLANGSTVSLTRRGRTLGRCNVADVGDHRASCRVDGAEPNALPPAQPGDRAVFDPVQAPPPKPAAALKPAIQPSADAVAAGLDTVLKSPLPKVVFARKAGRLALGDRASATLRARSWATVGHPDGVFVRPSIDVAGRGALSALPGWYGQAALRVQGDILAPGNERFRAGDAVEVYVWNAEVGLAGQGALVGALGRFRPRKAPGLPLLDGAQVGVRGFDGALEVGGWVGTVPDLVSVAPSFERISGGAYFASDLAPTKDLLFLPRLRVGLLTSPDLQLPRGEAEAELQMLWGRALSIGASSRVALAGEALTPVLDTARVDVDLVPSSSMRLRAGWRYLGAQLGDLDVALGAKTPVIAVRAGQHADATASITVTESLVLGATGGVAVDEESGDLRAFVGPELTFPRLFGDGGLAFGYLEEPSTVEGWWGRSGWVQATTRPLPLLSWSTRVSYFEHAAAVDALREVMVMSFVDAPVLPWLSVRGRAQGLMELPALDGGSVSPVGLFFDVGLSGNL